MPTRLWPRATLIASLVVAAGGGPGAAPAAAADPPSGDRTGGEPDSERYTLRAEIGAEYDSNAHRAEIVTGFPNPPVIASPLERFVLSWALSDAVADGQSVALAATAGAKLFDAPAAHDEDVAIAQSSVALQSTLGPATSLTAAGAYYEAFQRASNDLTEASERRDFRSLAPELRLQRALGDTITLGVAAGARWLVFKPDRDYDFYASVASADLRWLRLPDGGADWEASAGLGYEHRSFAGPALIDCPAVATSGLGCSGPDLRADDLLSAHADVVRTGRVLLGAGYGFSANLSNSFGETVIRHALNARLAAPLPLGLSLAARGDLLLAFYRDSVPVGQLSPGSPYVSIEDENRSSLRIDLSHGLGAHWRALARYTVYANEITAAPIRYRRQTLLLSLGYTEEK
ncbi:MAG TPA: hypothetical protein VLA79_00230 [Polyangia bacterium]|nr:hypothetical protein [Polyangia bacterium]